MEEKKKFSRLFFTTALDVLPIISEKTGKTTGRFRVRVQRADRFGNTTENSIVFPHDPYNGTNHAYLKRRAENFKDCLINYGLRRKTKMKPPLGSVAV